MRVGYPYRAADAKARRKSPLRRGDTRDFSAAGEYRSPPNGPGPGRGPYSWKSAPPLEAVDFTGPGWQAVAATSEHLSEIRFVYGFDSIKPLDRLGLGGIAFIRESGVSVLQVKFRDGGWAVYWSVPGTSFSAERLEAIYLMMESADHPGEIIWSHLIGKGASVSWPYDTSA